MIASVFAGALRLLCGCAARGRLPESDGRPRVYFANHTSHLDSLIVWTALPRAERRRLRIVAARDYWDRGPLRRWLACRVFRAVLVSRSASTRRDNLITAVEGCLDAGSSVLVFPEGSRGRGAEPGTFRPGLWHIARRHPSVYLVPVWIENLGRVLPKGELLPLPLLAAVEFGEPVLLREDEGKGAFLARARAAVLTLRGDRS